MRKFLLHPYLVFGLPLLLFLTDAFLYYVLKIGNSDLISVLYHTLGGLSMAMVFFYFFERNPELYSFKNKLLVNIVLAVSFAMLIGVLWEFMEFSIDYIFVEYAKLHPAQPSLADTMADLACDLIGATLFSLAYLRFSSSKENS